MSRLLSYAIACIIAFGIVLRASLAFHHFLAKCKDLGEGLIANRNHPISGCQFESCSEFVPMFGGSESAEAVIIPISHFIMVSFWIVHCYAYRKAFACACNATMTCLARGVLDIAAELKSRLFIMGWSDKVRLELLHQRTLLGKKMLSFVPHVLLLIVTTNHFTTLVAFDVTSRGNNKIWHTFFRSVIFPFSGSYVVCMALKVSHLTPVKLDCANIVLSSLWAWRYLNTEVEWYQYNAVTNWVLRFGGCIMFGNGKLSIMLQLALSLVDSSVYYFYFASQSNFVKLVHFDMYELDQKYQFWGYIVVQVFIFFAIAVLTLACEGLMVSQAEALVEAKRSLQVSTRVRRLLSGMCDVVVQLDEKLDWIEPCPQLGHLLLHASPDSVTQSRFLDLLAVADRERFQNYINREIEHQKVCEGGMIDLSPPSALHTHLVDSNFTLVAVEIFTSYCPDIDGAPSLLLGILQERESFAEVPEIVPNLPFHDLQALVKHETDVESCAASDCSHGSMIDYAVVCSVFTKGFPIESCSIAFASLCGSGQVSKGRKLLDLVGQPETFKQWVQACINNFGLDSSHCAGRIETTFPVVGNPFLELRCSCQMDDNWELDDVQNAGMARFVFGNFSVRLSSFKYRSSNSKRRRSLQNWMVEL